MTRAAFDAQMARMSGLRFPPGDTDTHWEGLQELPDPVLEAAVSRAIRFRVDFPVPAELREDADAVAHYARELPPEDDRGTDLADPVTIGTLPTGTPVTATRLWRFYHEDCGDSGIESLWCGEPGPQRKPWQLQQACERRAAHDSHEWTRRCTCYDSNPALIRKRERQQKFADAKAGRK